MKCQRCGQSLLHSQVQAGSPSRGFWVTFEDGRLGFDCPAGSGGHEPSPAAELLDLEVEKRWVDLGAHAVWVALGCTMPEQYAVCEEISAAVLQAVVPLRDATLEADRRADL